MKIMTIIHIYKAQPIADDVESVTINIDTVLPRQSGPDWLEKATWQFEEDARKIVNALHSLPGGTLDRVLVKLLAEKVSQHIVPWEKRG